MNPHPTHGCYLKNEHCYIAYLLIAYLPAELE